MKVIGLTGGIASGKSTVAQHIRQQGIPVFDADAVSKAVVAPGTEGLEKVIAAFGKEYLKDGGLDRKKIAEVVFNNKEKLKLLESIILTRVWEEAEQAIAEAKKQNSPMIVLDVPLLIEKDWYKKVDDNYIVLAKGRDYNDTVIDKGIFIGNVAQHQEVHVSVK